MKKIYSTLLFMLVAMISFSAAAEKTVTFNFSDPAAAWVLDPSEYTPVPKDDNGSCVMTISDTQGLSVNLASGFEFASVVDQNGVDLMVSATYCYIESSKMSDGSVITVTTQAKQPKTLEVVGDPKMVYLTMNYTDYKEDTNVDGKWTINANENEYGSTYVYCYEDYALKSVTDDHGNSYTWSSGQTSASIYHGSLPSGKTIVKVEAYSLAEARTASCHVEIEGDPSSVAITRNGGSNRLEASEAFDVAFDPVNELPLQIQSSVYGKSLYKVLLNGEEQQAMNGSFRVSPKDGDTIKVIVNFPDKDVNINFAFTNEDTEGVISEVYVDNQIVDASEYADGSMTVKLGSNLNISINSGDFELVGATLNGESIYADYGYSTIIYSEEDYNFEFEATKIEPYKLTVLCADPTQFFVTNGYTDEIYTLTGTETTVEVSHSYNYIKLIPADGFIVSRVEDPVSGYEVGTAFYMYGDQTIDVTCAPFVRENTMVVYYEDTDWMYTGITLSSSNYDVRKDITPEVGYNLVNFGDFDLPVYINGYPSFTNVYLNNVEIFGNYGNYEEFGSLKNGDVVKVFVNTPAFYDVTYTIGEGVNPVVKHDILSVIEAPATHSVIAGTQIDIASADENKVAVKVNGEAVTANEDGTFTLTADQALNVEITKDGATGLENITVESNANSDVYNLQGIRVNTPVNNLPAGIFIIGGM